MERKFHITLEAAEAVQRALSQRRLAEYLQNARETGHAIQLYQWNAEVCAAFMVPLHICEVVIRNGVSEVLSEAYGERWHSVAKFHNSLKRQGGGYSPAKELQAVAGRHSASRVMAELSFVFWQSLFTASQDTRLWIPYLKLFFPNLNGAESIKDSRRRMYSDIDQVRRLRNKVAHHEAIISRDLGADLERICGLVGIRCGETERWLRSFEGVTALLAKRP